MFNRILVPLDGSEAAESVFPYVDKFSLLFNSQVDVMGVCTEVENGLRRTFEMYLEKIATHLRNKRIKSETVLSCGVPAEQILDYAEKSNADLITLATYGRSGAKTWLAGSVATQIMRAAKVPILAVPPGKLTGELAIKKILVPLDGSDIEKIVLPYVEAIAKGTGALCVLFHVSEPPLPMIASYIDIKATEEQSRKLVKDHLDNIAAELTSKGIKAENKIVSGAPAMVILNYAETENVDLIVMPTRGRGGASRWLLGSVTERVLLHSIKPVLAIR